MGQKTGIEWTDATWNPVRGCSRVSQGCVNCYAERQAARFVFQNVAGEGGEIQKPGPFHGFVTKVNGHAAWTGKVELVEKHFADPLHWKQPRKIFVNSMSDLFHEALPDEAIDRVFAVMALCPQHTFQILTKRPERMREYLSSQTVQSRIGAFQWGIIEDRVDPLDRRSDDMRATALDPDEDWPLPNVWLGVSVEDQATADERIPLLLQTPAAVRFVSYEPALGPVSFRWAKWVPFGEPGTTSNHLDGLKGLDWIIAGGESGPGARPAHPQWFRDVRDQSVAAGVAFFFKQWGEHAPLVDTDGVAGSPFGGHIMSRVGKKAAGSLLDGREWKEFPEVRTA